MHDSLTTSRGLGRSRRLLLALVGALATTALLLTGCAATSSPGKGSSTSQGTPSAAPNGHDEAPAEAATGSAGTATFTVGDRVFTVELTLCGIYADATEIVLAGHATESSGGPSGFLEGDLLPFGDEINGEFRIDIGADGPTQSADEFLALGYASGTPVTLEQDGSGYIIRSGAWNENGEDLGAGTLAFACS